MATTFYNLFFRNKYYEAVNLVRDKPDVLQSDTDRYHYVIANILLGNEITAEDLVNSVLPNFILELEALRQESGFNYEKALLFRQAIAIRVNDFCNLLGIAGITLKTKPISECNFNFIKNISPDNYYPSSVISNRILDFLRHITVNSGLRQVPSELLEFARPWFDNYLINESTYLGYLFNGELNFYLEDYDKALYYFYQARNITGDTGLIQNCIAKTLYKQIRYCEALDYLRSNLAKLFDDFWSKYSLSGIYGAWGKYQEATILLEDSLGMINQRIIFHTRNSNIFRRFGKDSLAKVNYYGMIFLTAIYNDICSSLGSISIYSKREDYINLSQQLCLQASKSYPTSVSTFFVMSDLSKKMKSNFTPMDVLQYGLRIAPSSWEIASKIIGLWLDDFKVFEPLNLASNFLQQYIEPKNRLTCLSIVAKCYLDLGEREELARLLDEIQEILIIKDFLVTANQCLEIYSPICFFVPSVRDNILFNSLMFSTISDKFKPVLHEGIKLIYKLFEIDARSKKKHSQIKKIGFISPNFRGHVVSLLSIDVIKEMSEIPGIEVYMIPLSDKCEHSDFLKEARQIQTIKILELYETVAIKINSLIELDLDILIELDGATSSLTPPILYSQPATVNCSWLGFDAPYISEDNYFLCDQYTHPPEVDEFYPEKLIRLPHSHMCVKEFEVANKDRDEFRKKLGISEDQIAFIYPPAVRKFNYETADVIIQILSRVTNSVLLMKSSLGFTGYPLQLLREKLEEAGFSADRIIYIERTPTTAEHRFYFKAADIYLDSYPYNGGSQTLEALWCDLPVVTYCGEQSFARMGYSLLSTAGITEGIAHSWEEYIDWAVRLATDHDLRLSIKERLAKGKNPDNLCPLWNPKQFARDMYNILQELYEQAEA